MVNHHQRIGYFMRAKSIFSLSASFHHYHYWVSTGKNFHSFYRKNDAMTKRSRFENGQQNLWYWRLQCWYQKLFVPTVFSLFSWKKSPPQKERIEPAMHKSIATAQYTPFNKWPLITNDERVVWFCIQRISFVAINELFMSISLTTKEMTTWKKETQPSRMGIKTCAPGEWAGSVRFGSVVGVSCVMVNNEKQTNWEKTHRNKHVGRVVKKKQLLLLLNFPFLFNVTMWWNGAGNRQHLFGIFRTICELFCKKRQKCLFRIWRSIKETKTALAKRNHWHTQSLAVARETSTKRHHISAERAMFALFICVILRHTTTKHFHCYCSNWRHFLFSPLMCFCYSFVQTVAISGEGWQWERECVQKIIAMNTQYISLWKVTGILHINSNRKQRLTSDKYEKMHNLTNDNDNNKRMESKKKAHVHALNTNATKRIGGVTTKSMKFLCWWFRVKCALFCILHRNNYTWNYWNSEWVKLNFINLLCAKI